MRFLSTWPVDKTEPSGKIETHEVLSTTPAVVRMQLFPHQLTGVDWLASQPRHAGLFDEPGLGKTAVAIRAADRVGGSLFVAAPAVAVWNWKREIERWSPSRRVQVVDSSATPLDRRADAIVVTHGMTIRGEVARQILARQWAVGVLDEAHHFRTPSAKRTRAFYGVPSRPNALAILQCLKRCWALTGTPMPNNPSELWTMLAALASERIAEGGRLMRWAEFRARYCKLVPSAYGDGWKVVGAQNQGELRERLKGFALRRKKTDHLDLPPIRFGTVALRADTATVQAIEDALSPETRVRLAKAPPEKVLEIISGGEHFARFRRVCGLAKVKPTVNLLLEELNGGLGQVVVFAHHIEVLDGIVSGMDKAKIAVAKIDGGVTPRQRQALVDSFQDGALRVLVCQLTAGGVAITLTNANNVLMVEQSFVPGDNMQAADRLHRIGQDKAVLCRMISLTGSIDEILVEILARKTAMIQEVLR